MILVDSTVWINYFNGVSNPEVDKLDLRLDTDIVLIGDLILAEVLQGFRKQADFEAARETLLEFSIVEIGGTTLAIKSAENCRALRRRGVTVRKTIDVFIATYCIENQIPLLHSDRDFDKFEKLGLKVA